MIIFGCCSAKEPESQDNNEYVEREEWGVRGQTGSIPGEGTNSGGDQSTSGTTHGPTGTPLTRCTPSRGRGIWSQRLRISYPEVLVQNFLISDRCILKGGVNLPGCQDQGEQILFRPLLRGEELCTHMVFFVQSILTDRYILRREL